MYAGKSKRALRGARVPAWLVSSALAVAVLLPGAASAATINVTTTVDEFGGSQRCSLREALWSANHDSNADTPGCKPGSGTDTVVVPGGRFALDQAPEAEQPEPPEEGEEPAPPVEPEPVAEDEGRYGDLDLTSPVKLVHKGLNRAIVASAVPGERVIHNLSEGSTLQGLTIAGGSATTEDEDHGGGVLNAGVLTVQSSTIVDNRAVYGGGISTEGPATTKVVNSTISGNRAHEDGGGVSVETDGTVTLRSSTVSENEADADQSGGGEGGGVFASTSGAGGVLELQSTIVGDNRDRGGEADDCASLGGTISSLGHNLVGNTNGCELVEGAKDILNRKIRMLPLDDNGGPTYTHALMKTSPALDSGAGCPSVDQRGVKRTRCDIGAWELVRCEGAVVNRIGTNGSDNLTGTDGRDGILALGGNDTVDGGAGNDGICGGAGADELLGGAGNDALNGDGGKDTCKGGSGRNVLTKCEIPKKKKAGKKKDRNGR